MAYLAHQDSRRKMVSIFCRTTTGIQRRLNSGRNATRHTLVRAELAIVTSYSVAGDSFGDIGTESGHRSPALSKGYRLRHALVDS